MAESTCISLRQSKASGIRLATNVAESMDGLAARRFTVDASEWSPDRMSARFLAWYIGAMLGLICIVLALITVAPAAERQFVIVQVACATGMSIFVCLGTIAGCLAADHWVN